MKLQIISEWGPEDAKQQTDETKRLKNRLAQIRVGSIIDYNEFKKHIPIMYAPSVRKQVFIGEPQSYHMDLIEDNKYGYEELGEIYNGVLDVPVLTGRIGKGFNNGKTKQQKLISVVAFYNNGDANLLRECIEQLLDKKLINNSTYIIFQKRVISVQEELSKAKPKPKLIDFEEPTPPAKPTWGSEMSKQGLLTPGQKWWAPTSEDTQR